MSSRNSYDYDYDHAKWDPARQMCDSDQCVIDAREALDEAGVLEIELEELLGEDLCGYLTEHHITDVRVAIDTILDERSAA